MTRPSDISAPQGATHDIVYDGQVHLIQPQKGFRAGTDSLLLAAAVDAKPNGEALELGCGCGGALLPAAFRLSETRFTGVDIDPDMVALAREGAVRNGFQSRLTLEQGEASAWVKPHENRFELVFANPPYFRPGQIHAPGEGKSSAYVESLDLPGWIKAMAFAAKPRAPIVLIHRAAELARILATLDRVAGDITVLPIASKVGDNANRVLVRGRKGLKRGEVRLLSPLIRHVANGDLSERAISIQAGQRIDW